MSTVLVIGLGVAVAFAAPSITRVDTLQPSWAPGAYAAYYPHPDASTSALPVSPGSTAVYAGHEAAIIKAGQGGLDYDEGLLGFAPVACTLGDLVPSGALTYDVAPQHGTNPVWVRLEIDTGVLGDRDDNETYQCIPAPYGAGWNHIDAGAGQWQLMDAAGNGTGPLMDLSTLAASKSAATPAVRVYLTLGMGPSYRPDANGTVAWVDKAVIGATTYDFVVARETFTITASASAHGSIWPSGPQVVTAGSNLTAIITPAVHYHVSDVLVDGVSVGAVPAYTFTDVGANHSITASFAIDTFTITKTAGANGSIGGATSVDYGSNAAFTITPATGYHVAGVTVDGTSIGAVTSYTFTNVTADHTIAATFAGNTASPSSITIKTSRTSASIGQVFILSGLVTPTPDMIGRNMHVDVKKPGKTYWSYSSARTIYSNAGVASWWYRYTLVGGMVRGTYLFKAVYDGDGAFAPSQSSIISVIVR